MRGPVAHLRRLGRAQRLLAVAAAAALAVAILAGPARAQTGNDAAFVRQSVPTTMAAGSNTLVFVTFENTGTTTWTRAAGYKLGSQNPQNNTTWGLSRAHMKPNDSIAPGQRKRFTFTITAPSTPGTYNFQWQMLQAGVGFFGELSTNVAISVT